MTINLKNAKLPVSEKTNIANRIKMIIGDENSATRIVKKN